MATCFDWLGSHVGQAVDVENRVPLLERRFVRVELTESELIKAGYNAETFKLLSIQTQRWIAAGIMRNRTDDRSQFAAEMMERANPNFNDFVVLVGV